MKLEKRLRGVMRPAPEKLPVRVRETSEVTRPAHTAAIILITIALTAAGFPLSAQTYPFREYTSDDGLPQTQLANMMQDSRGYLWIPTRNGLARFDGYTFISYLRKDGLPSNQVGRVVEDENGTIWAITLNGVARFNGKSFISYPVPDSLGVKQVGNKAVIIDTASFLLNASIDFETQILLLFEKGTYRNFTEANPALRGVKLTAIAIAPDDSTVYLIDEEFRAYSYSHGNLKQVHSGPVTDVEFIDGNPQFADLLGREATTIEPFFWEGGTLAVSFIDSEGTVWAGTETSLYRLMSRAFVEYDRENGLPEETWA
ncbi:MAG: hypothetical protein MUE37_14420, partial [Bacteroidales bacterium]|nr:hypothetical protein [Bacteroidales bacterium]